MAVTRPIWLPRDPPERLTPADFAAAAAFGAAVFIFVWWLRFWLGWLIWLGLLVWGGR